MTRPVRSQRHESELGWWAFHRIDPHPALRPFLGAIYGYEESTPGFSRRLEGPMGACVLIIGLGEPIAAVGDEHGPLPRQELGSFVAGLSDGASVIESPGSQSGVEVTLNPLGARMMFGVAGHELASRIIDLEALIGGAGRRLVERLGATPSWSERLRTVESALASLLRRATPPSPGLVWAWSSIAGGDGLSVGELRGRLGWSERRLRREFRDGLGLGPKRCAAVIRVEHATQRLLGHAAAGSATPVLAELAQECGWYDQAHMNRDFRTMVGLSPGELWRRRLPGGGGFLAPEESVQDQRPTDVAASPA